MDCTLECTPKLRQRNWGQRGRLDSATLHSLHHAGARRIQLHVGRALKLDERTANAIISSVRRQVYLRGI